MKLQELLFLSLLNRSNAVIVIGGFHFLQYMFIATTARSIILHSNICGQKHLLPISATNYHVEQYCDIVGHLISLSVYCSVMPPAKTPMFD
jgi:hypothetical protein